MGVGRRQEVAGRWERLPRTQLCFSSGTALREREREYVYVCVFVFMIGGDTGGPEHPRPAHCPVRIPMTPV